MAKKKLMQLLGMGSGGTGAAAAAAEKTAGPMAHVLPVKKEEIEYIKLTNVYRRNKMFMEGVPNGNPAFLPVVIRVRDNRTFMEGDQIKMGDLQGNNLFFDFIGRIPGKKGWYGRK
ncbi:MAG: hypothetical protein WC552_10180 [Candidatus Omnitrophota bacterium]